MSSDGTPKYSSQLINSIVGAIGDYNTVNIQQPSGQPAPYQLPPMVKDFTGREQELDQIAVAVQQHGTVALHGMGGVGKSALAIAVAHRLRADFPDAHLYANLYGQSQPLDAHAVLIRLLRALTGQNESQLPTDLEGLQGVYRSALAEKRVLIVLDNARDASHVVPLLAGEVCGVILTSRQTLSLSGVQNIRLGAMKLDEALELLERISQRTVVDEERSVAMQIVSNCGRLPLAVRIVGALLHRRSQVSLAEVAVDLRDERDRLTTFATQHGKLGTDEYLDVRSSFELSYRGLMPEQKAVFAQVSAIPGLDFGLAVAAAVSEQPESNLREWLDALADEQLLQVSPERRYEFHDLMRLFAREQLAKEEQGTLLDRALDWYCESAADWNNALDPLRCRELALVLTEEFEMDCSPKDLEQALPRMTLDRFAMEQKNWVDVVKQLAKLQRVKEVTELTAKLVPFFILRSVWDDWVTTHEIAKACAERAGDIESIFYVFNHLGLAYTEQGRWEEAINTYEQSLQISSDLGDQKSIFAPLLNLGGVYLKQGQWEEAIAAFEQSLHIANELSDRHQISQVLMNLGVVYGNQGRWQDAIDAFEKALQTMHDLGDRYGTAQVLNGLGNVYSYQGRWQDAIDAFEKSLQTHREWGNIHGIATTLTNLGLVYSNQGRWQDAISVFEQSLQTMRDLGDVHCIATTLVGLGVVHFKQGRWEEAINVYKQSLQISHDLGDQHGIAQALMHLGHVYRYQGRWEEAIHAYGQSLQTTHALGDLHYISQTTMGLGIVHLKQEHWEESISAFEQSLQISHDLGDRHGIAQALMHLGIVYRCQGRWEEAITTYEQSLQIKRELEHRHGIAEILGNLGNVYLDQGRWEEAIDTIERHLQSMHDLGDPYGEGLALANLGLVYEKRNQPSEAKTLWQQALTKLHPDSPDFQTVQQWIEELEVKNAKLKMGCGDGLLVSGIVVFLLVCLFKGQWIIAGFGLLVLGGLWARKLNRARIRKSHKSR